MSSDPNWADAMAARTRVRDALKALLDLESWEVAPTSVLDDLDAAVKFLNDIIDRIEPGSDRG